jgi:hypothetical protein
VVAEEVLVVGFTSVVVRRRRERRGRRAGGDVGTAVGIDEIVGDAVGFLIRFPSSMQKGNFQSCRLGRNPMDTSTSGVATSKARPPDWPPSVFQLNSAVTQPMVLLTQTNSKSAAGDRPPAPTGSQIWPSRS